MTFRLSKKTENLQTFMRRAGYKPIGVSTRKELNCVRPLQGAYPRFHIYAKEEKGEFVINLHLDQKRPSYEGSRAHSGDYDSETVKSEMERIQSLV